MLIGQIRYAPESDRLSGGYDPVASAVKMVKNGVDAVALFTDETLYRGFVKLNALRLRTLGQRKKKLGL